MPPSYFSSLADQVATRIRKDQPPFPRPPVFAKATTGKPVRPPAFQRPSPPSNDQSMTRNLLGKSISHGRGA